MICATTNLYSSRKSHHNQQNQHNNFGWVMSSKNTLQEFIQDKYIKVLHLILFAYEPNISGGFKINFFTSCIQYIYTSTMLNRKNDVFKIFYFGVSDRGTYQSHVEDKNQM